MKREQLYGCNFHYTRYPLSYFIDCMKKYGLKYLEFYAATPHFHVDDYNADEARQIKKQLDDAGLSVKVITAEQCLYPISMVSPDPIARERALKYYEKTLELGHALGSEAFQVMGGFPVKGQTKQDYEPLVMQGLYRVCEKAREYGMKVILEADASSAVQGCKEIKETIQKLNHPNLTGMIDFGALYFNNEDFEEGCKILGDDLFHIHANNVQGRKSCFPIYDGDIDCNEWFSILDKYNYQGGVTPELWGFRFVHEADEVFAKTVEFWDKYLEN